MSFQFSNSHIEQFQTYGYTIFRGILPPTLIDDLRAACEAGREAARRQSTQAQRFGLQALSASELKAFENYRDLPELVDAVERVLGPGTRQVDFKYTSILIEPGELPWCTQWHRDWRDNVPGLDLQKWESVQNDIALFNQVNCALYEDSCTWIVPGSHNRRDTDAEANRFPERPIPAPELEGKSPAERERECYEYCQSMPGAMQAFLQAGDFMLYRSVQWHIGNYLPYKKRCTIHEGVMTPRFTEYWNEAVRQSAERNQNGAVWENPNFPERNAVRELAPA
jgi:hypothetical protein